VSSAPAPELQVGEPIEAELSPGESHLFTIAIEPGQYVRVVARPRTIDVALRLFAPDRAVLATADGPGGSRKPELLSLLTSVAGEAHLEVTRRDEGERRGYQLLLQERRPARDGDLLRIETERAYYGAIHRRSLGSAEEMRTALATLELALPLWRQIGDLHGEVDTLTQIGLSHRSLGATDKAVECLTRSIALAESVGYPEGLAEAVNGLALADKHRGRLDAALAGYRRALAIARERGSTEQEAKVLQNIGMLLFERGESQQAREHLELALPLWQEIGDLGEEGNTAQTLGLTHLYHDGRLDMATQHFQRALTLSRAASDRRTEAGALLNLGAIYRRRRQLQSAVVAFRDATERFRAIGDQKLLALSQESLGSLYYDLGDFGRAAHHYQEAEMSYRSQGDVNSQARVLTSAGLIDQRRGNLETARGYFEQALLSSQQVGNARTEAMARERLGVLLRETGDLDAAKESLLQALELHQRIGDRSEEAYTLAELGTCESRQGRAQAASDHFADARELARSIENPALEAAVLLRWGEHDRDIGDLESALQRIQAAQGIVESTRSSVLSRDLRATYFASQRQHAELHIDVLMRLEERHPHAGHQALALGVSEWARARSLLELLAEGRVELEAGFSPELKERETKLEERVQDLGRRLTALLSTPDASSLEVARLRQDLAALGEEHQEIEAEIRRRHPRYAQVRYPRPLRLDEIRALLDGRSALLEYFLGTESSFLFVVKRDSLSCYRLPPAREIAGLVTRLRQGLEVRERRRLGGYMSAAQRLYELLVAPAASSLANVTNLIIAPDRALHLLPFEVLLTNEGALAGGSLQALPFLVQRYAVTYVPSATALASLRDNPQDRRGRGGETLRFVAFADPPLDATSLPSRLPPLPGARREVLEIASQYRADEAMVFLGADASEENVKTGGHLQQASRIHFATHAIVDEALPELTALVLAARPDSGEDGFLHAYELFDLKLGADVVVLSGCDTGLGREISGEGLIGLTQALFFAGARSVVVSLWPVADAASPSLMPEFYRRIDGGMSKAEALRQTKLRMKASERWAHPFYWAQFILVGDGERSPVPEHVTMQQEARQVDER
jgi:CHAT domain-containing protein/Tfp pilus assembly protein PilF